MTVTDSRQRAGETKRRRSRASIVAAASELFSTVGWHDASFDKIAKLSGNSAPTTRNHFPAKKHVLVEVYRPLVDEVRSETAQDLEAATPPMQAVERLVRRLSELTRAHPTLTTTMLTAVREETVANDKGPDAELLRRELGLSGLMASCLQAGKDAGDFPADLPVDDVASYHTNALLLRLFAVADETAEETAALVLSQLRPVLEPVPGPAEGGG